MSLFQRGEYTLHSGGMSKYLIDADTLSDEDLETVAARLSELTGPFGGILWIPTGGERIGKALEAHVTKGSSTLLLVDDVWTTGNSMTDARESLLEKMQPEWDDILGAVIFVRGWAVPDWLYAFAFVDV